MADQSNRISQLKIDRSTPVASGRSWFWPGLIAVADSVLDASGYVVARRQTTVSSKVTGKVLEVFVEEGMRVEQDQVVAVLDDTSQQVELSLAKACAVGGLFPAIRAARLPVAQALREL